VPGTDLLPASRSGRGGLPRGRWGWRSQGLQKIVNGGGFIDREYAVGRGHLDLCVRWPHPGGIERWAAELKVWRDRRADPLEDGLVQLSGYLTRLGLDRGTLILFDARSTAAPLADRCSRSEVKHAGRTITVVRL